MTTAKNGGCFDCGRTEEVLTSTTVSPAPRQTSRGLIPPGCGSVALCNECLKRERATVQGGAR